MSIINQALKKAQREQRLHSMQSLFPITQASPSRSSRRLWLATALGCGMALGTGTLLYVWLMPLAAPPPAALHTAVPSTPAPGNTAPAAGTLPATAVTPRPVRRKDMATPLPSGMTAAPPQGTPMPVPQLIDTTRRGATIEVLPERPQVPQPGPTVPPDRTDTPATPVVQPLTATQTHVHLALTAQAAGDPERAMTHWQKAIKLDPTLKQAYTNLGNLYYQQQQYGDAVAMYHQALALDADDLQVRNNLGSAYIQLSQPERAIAELQKVLHADGEASLAYYNLACVYARTGNSTQAMQYLQRAMELEPQARVWAQTDSDFSRVRTEPAFQRLLGPS